MLSPEYLNHVTDDIVALMQELEDSIIADMAERLTRIGYTETSEWQTMILQEAGGVFSHAASEIAKRTGVSESIVQQIFEEAGFKAISHVNDAYIAAGLPPVLHGLGPRMLSILSAGLEKTHGDMLNLTRTTAAMSQQSFIKGANLAYMQVASGAMSYDQAIAKAIRNIGGDGVWVLYPDTGHRDRLDVATRRAVLTGVNQTAAAMQLALARDLETDLVEVTAHLGARPSHAVWQGRVYSLSKSNRSYPDFIDSTRYGQGDGLAGWNCRHSFYPFIESVSTRTYSDETLRQYRNATVTVNGKEMPLYEAMQKQRALERNIRASKRELNALSAGLNGADGATAQAVQREYQQAAVKLKARREALSAFTGEAGLREQGARSQVAGFGRSEAAKASWANRRVAELEKQTIQAYNEAANAFRADILSGKQKLAVIPQKQAPHLVDTWLRGKSYIEGSLEDAQKLVDRYAGTGRFERDTKGGFTKREIVKTDMPIGMVAYANGDLVATSSFKIHYRKTGTHIVPRWEEDE